MIQFFAISTALGEGAIAIVRVSGDDAVEKVDRIFKGKDLTKVPSHTIHYGHIVDLDTNQVIEEVMVSIMRAPRTFTRENIVEINCHGGLVSVNKVLQLILAQGVRLAEPGEFTKRAFKWTYRLITSRSCYGFDSSKTDRAMNVAINQMEGRLSKLIGLLRQEILETLAHVEVNIDYPEYDDVEEMTHNILIEKAMHVRSEIEKY